MKKGGLFQTASGSKQEYCELVNVEAVLEGYSGRHRHAVNLLRLELDLSCRRDRLFGQTVRQTAHGRDRTDRSICHKRDLERNTALNVVRAGLVGIGRFWLEDDLQ